MKKLLSALALAATATLSLTSFAPDAFAQAQNGRGVGLHRLSISYYKTPPGRQDEWLALYRQWHRPIIEENIRNGQTTSSRLYIAGNHSPGQPWDFAIVSVSPPNPPRDRANRAEQVRRLFPNQEAFLAGERARWALTIHHWDESFVPLSWDQEPLSLYAPIGTAVEPR